MLLGVVILHALIDLMKQNNHKNYKVFIVCIMAIHILVGCPHHYAMH